MANTVNTISNSRLVGGNIHLPVDRPRKHSAWEPSEKCYIGLSFPFNSIHFA